MKSVYLVMLAALLSLSSAIAQGAPSRINVSSAAFQGRGTIPDRFTCKGANTNPPLQFEGIPKNARSLVLIMDDPDAPGGLFNHWLVWNIAPATSQIAENSVPTGATQGTNDFGKTGYDGPCPPSGTHRYYFRVFALDQKLDLKSGAKRAALDRALHGHVVARGELMARCSR
jgi:Raf kinase inhibitor-like YbhB/YbcL family protein